MHEYGINLSDGSSFLLQWHGKQPPTHQQVSNVVSQKISSAVSNLSGGMTWPLDRETLPMFDPATARKAASTPSPPTQQPGPSSPSATPATPVSSTRKADQFVLGTQGKPVPPPSSGITRTWKHGNYNCYQFSDGTVAYQSPNGGWMNQHQYARFQPRMPVDKTPAGFNWPLRFDFNNDDYNNIADNIDSIADKEVAVGGNILAPIGTGMGGYDPAGKVPLPTRGVGGKLVIPPLTKPSVGGVVTAAGAGLTIGGEGAHGVAAIIRKLNPKPQK